LATEACGACHDDPVIIARYSLRGDVVGSYVDSYHGWTSRRGYASAATCVSCHTAHAILPRTHPQSTIHPDNLQETCRQCHERVDERFAASYTHESLSITANPINRWIRNAYWVLIASVIGGMVAHNLVILNFHAVRKRRELERVPTVRRLDLAQILQHGLTVVSFIVLVITGFALRFPDAWWVRSLAALGLDEPLRAGVHRVAGVVLVLVTIAHVFYVVLARRGRREFRAMLPSRLDFREAVENLRYHTWRRDRPAEFGRYDYTQKAEYWALAWGTVLMIVTGAVLWFPGLAVRFVPAWVITASQTVHYYEAWLAALAILVWHLFFVLFHPDEYPMNWTWLSGKMTLRAVEKHHPRWYREEFADADKKRDSTSDSD
jgi:formate dehydrogenase gamma subunit